MKFVYKICIFCGRKANIKWYLQHLGYENVLVCEECDLSLKEQIGDDYLPFYSKGVFL